MKKLALILSSLIVCSSIVAQTLLTINDKEISKQEFEYYYKKNNHIESDTLSAEAYLDMFINFKLKVEEAYALKYDTAASFKEEFDSYRGPIAAKYMNDSIKRKELEEEAYKNLLKEVEVSHILFRITNPEDSTLAYEKALAAKKRAKKMDFNKLAEEVSEDPSVVRNKGYLGWTAGMTMVYPFEKAAFSLKKGKISEPVRTRFGYHVIKVHNTRPTRGEIQAAHIFKRIPEGADSAQIDAIRKEMHRIRAVIDNGGEFEDLVKAHSEDTNTKKGGVIPFWITTGSIEKLFEDAAFALKEIGDVSPVVEAPYGFHIIKLVDKKEIPDYNRWMPQIQTRIARDERAEIIHDSFINKLKKEYNYKFINNDSIIAQFADVTITREDVESAMVLYPGGEEGQRIEDWDEYKLKTIIDFNIMLYEDSQLERKHPEFALLMQEYRDGILLFNISKDVVWDKASKDEDKLKEIYEKGNFDKPYNKVRGIIISQYQDELEKEWVKELREKYTVTINQKVLDSIK